MANDRLNSAPASIDELLDMGLAALLHYARSTMGQPMVGKAPTTYRSRSDEEKPESDRPTV
jgi:hypothetical protein